MRMCGNENGYRPKFPGTGGAWNAEVSFPHISS